MKNCVRQHEQHSRGNMEEQKEKNNNKNQNINKSTMNMKAHSDITLVGSWLCVARHQSTACMVARECAS